MCQASTCGLLQVLQISGSQMVVTVLRFTTMSELDSHLRNPRKKKYIECSNILGARVSTDGHSATQNGRWAAEIQHSSRIETMSHDSLQPVLTTKPVVSINYRRKTVHESLYFATCNWFFWVQDCCTWIHLIVFKIDWNWSWNIFTSELAQFLLNAHRAANQPWKSENW